MICQGGRTVAQKDHCERPRNLRTTTPRSRSTYTWKGHFVDRIWGQESVRKRVKTLTDNILKTKPRQEYHNEASKFSTLCCYRKRTELVNAKWQKVKSLNDRRWHYWQVKYLRNSLDAFPACGFVFFAPARVCSVHWCVKMGPGWWNRNSVWEHITVRVDVEFLFWNFYFTGTNMN